MKKIFLSVLALFLLSLTACSAVPSTDTVSEEAARIERALQNEFGDDLQKISETEVYEFPFSDGNGNTIVYYLCETTYFDSESDKPAELDSNILGAVFDTVSAQLEKELDISDRPSAIYNLDDRAYLCCFASSEHTLILEYSPESLSEADAVKTILSVFEPVE